jgi:hypothetical protein
VNRPWVPIGLCALVVLGISAVSAAQFTGWVLPATELDFLLVPRILASGSAFEGTAYLSLAKTLNAMSVLPATATTLAGAGLPLERQMTYFAAVQAAMVCIAVTGLMVVLNGRKTPWLVLTGLLLFVASGNHYLYYFKIVSSTFVSGFVLLALTLILARRYWPAAVVTALIGAAHPTYFLLTLAAIGGMQWVSSSELRSIRARLIPLVPVVVLAIPVFVAWMINYEAILQPEVDSAAWFTFMSARSDLSFPLRQGYYAITAMIAPLVLAGLVLRRERRVSGEANFDALAALAAGGVLLVLVQIVSSEFLKSATLTRLALSHRLPFTIDVYLFAAVLWVVLRRVSRNGVLAWIGLLWFCVLRAFEPGVFTAAGVNATGTLMLAVLALQTIEDASTEGAPRLARVGGAWCAAMAMAVLLSRGVSSSALVALLILAAWIELALRLRQPGLLRSPLMPGVALAIVAALSAAVTLKAVDATRNAGRSGRANYAEFIDFVTRNVAPDEQIIAVPFFLTQRLTPVPYRSVFLDWVESNYVLYLGSHLNDATARLAAYGIDVSDRPPGCTVKSMFLAGTDGAANARCERRWFQHLAESKVTSWREHIDDIHRLAPRTSWALIRQDLVCSGERGIAWKDLRLVRLNDVVRSARCDGQ